MTAVGERIGRSTNKAFASPESPLSSRFHFAFISPPPLNRHFTASHRTSPQKRMGRPSRLAARNLTAQHNQNNREQNHNRRSPPNPAARVLRR